MNSDPVLYSEPEIVHCIHQGITCKNLQNKIYFSAWRLLLSLIGGGGEGEGNPSGLATVYIQISSENNLRHRWLK